MRCAHEFLFASFRWNVYAKSRPFESASQRAADICPIRIQAGINSGREALLEPLTRSQKICGKRAARFGFPVCTTASHSPVDRRRRASCRRPRRRSPSCRDTSASVVGNPRARAIPAIAGCFAANACREPTRLSACGDRGPGIANQQLSPRFDFVLCESDDKHLTYPAPAQFPVCCFNPLF